MTDVMTGFCRGVFSWKYTGLISLPDFNSMLKPISLCSEKWYSAGKLTPVLTDLK